MSTKQKAPTGVAAGEGLNSTSGRKLRENYTYAEPDQARKPRLTDSATIEILRRRLPDYLAAVGVELRRQGARLVGRCPHPAHDDSNPSFAVFGANHEICGCHPCNNFTGDVFALSQWLGRSGPFPEAVADVADVLGVHLPQSTAGTATRPATPPQRPAKQPAPPFVLSDADRQKIHTARLAFSDDFHAGETIIDRIAASLGFNRETLRYASWGSSGLGLAEGWLCYAYPQGLKWRNPNPDGKPRFRWIVGKPLAPWRMEWVTAGTRTVYLTEGESDCLALIAAGIEADGTAVCVASPGTSFAREWVPLFAGKRVVICFDLDSAGHAATARVAGILQGTADEVFTWRGTACHV